MTTLIRRMSAVALLVASSFAATTGLAPLSQPALGYETPDEGHTGLLRIGYDEPLPATRKIFVALNKTMIVELPRDLRDVVVSNPEFLDAVVQTSTRVYLIAKKMGDANVFFFDENGEQVLTLEVRIEVDMAVLDRLLARVLPGSNVKSEMLNDTVVLTGTVMTAADATRASDIAARYVTRPGETDKRYYAKVINLLQVESKEQVMLKVTVAEVARDAIKRLGVNWAGAHTGDMGIGGTTSNTFPITNANGNNSVFYGVFGPAGDRASCLIATAAFATNSANCLAAAVDAFERDGILKTLAEPTLAAISGETASFLAGGEFPVPVGQDKDSITVEWKPFGVGLSFTPMVMSEGRVSLKIATEVSELTTAGAVTLTSISLPGLKVRRANTTVELPSGGSLVIAGLISDSTRQNIDGLPGIKDLPILGTLFRSRDFQKQETELLIMVTPYMVNPVAASQIALPTDNLYPASDARANFLGQLNKIYGRKETLPEGEYVGSYGFIVE